MNGVESNISHYSYRIRCNVPTTLGSYFMTIFMLILLRLPCVTGRVLKTALEETLPNASEDLLIGSFRSRWALFILPLMLLFMLRRSTRAPTPKRKYAENGPLNKASLSARRHTKRNNREYNVRRYARSHHSYARKKETKAKRMADAALEATLPPSTRDVKHFAESLEAESAMEACRVRI